MTETHLFTIFLDYLGGTYISQVESANPSEALESWARSLPVGDLTEWNLKRDVLLMAIRDQSLVSLADCVNVWCLSGVDGEGEQLLLNVISTVKS